MHPLKAYAQTQQQTASKERLMVMLFEAALKHMRQGALHLEGGQAEAAVTPLTKASDIVVELMATLDRPRAPELCDSLFSVYEFVALRLTRASLMKDAVAARDAERAFAPLVDAFQTAVAQTAQGAP